jgi:hypothetical protein
MSIIKKKKRYFTNLIILINVLLTRQQNLLVGNTMVTLYSALTDVF